MVFYPAGSFRKEIPNVIPVLKGQSYATFRCLSASTHLILVPKLCIKKQEFEMAMYFKQIYFRFVKLRNYLVNGNTANGPSGLEQGCSNLL